MITAFRIVKTRRIATAFDGEGSKLYGGRWNSGGVAVVYTSRTLSLATLEILVHAEHPALFGKAYSHIKVTIPEECVEDYPIEKLSKGWNSGVATKASQQIGDEWVKEQRSLAICLPSAVIPSEQTILINPVHPDRPRLEIHPAAKFSLDGRLWKP